MGVIFAKSQGGRIQFSIIQALVLIRQTYYRQVMNDWELKGRDPVYYRRIRNFHEDLAHDILRDQIVLSAEFALSKDPIPLAQSIDLPRVAIREGTVWGRTWDSGYFALRAKVPEAWRGKSIAALLNFGGEGLVYSRNGDPLFGITSGSAFMEHYDKELYLVSPECRGGEEVEILVEAAANQIFGVKEALRPISRTDPSRHGSWEAKLNKARLGIFDEAVRSLYIDIGFLLELYDDLDRRSVRAARILKALFDVTQAYREDPGNADACRQLLAPELKKPASASALATTVVGHSHIDTAWLWRLRETRRKVARTFASQLDLLSKYPGYVFGASAPQHHAWVKEDYPAMYGRIKDAVAAGRWEPQGGMWIEADCNLISGESMVRQLLHGKNFWKDEFGVEVRNCWLPDVFGYPASMPQILKKAGIDFFLTQKLSWSKMNEFPHDTFLWQGIDGSLVLTHFPPEYTYNSFCDPKALRKAETTFHEKAFLDEFITLMGVGDGGGGPKDEHLENALRARDLESLPKASFGRADELFARFAGKVPLLGLWVGELYLELHRGTYTSQASTKRNNKRLEGELSAVEALCSCLPQDDYPSEELDAVVKTLLLHQFHDILPGSSIHAVYEDAESEYRRAFEALERIKAAAAHALLIEEADSLCLFNSLSQEYRGVIPLPEGFEASALVDQDGEAVPVQVEDDLVVAKVRIPSMGFGLLKKSVEAARASPKSAPFDDDPALENDLVRYRFDADARLVEAFDKASGASFLKTGSVGNLLCYYQDTPHNYDAWDIDFYYPAQLLETAKGLSSRFIADGSVRRGLRFELKVGNSTIVQKVFLEGDSTALSFVTSVDWNESYRMLRVSFPLSSNAAEAGCGIQFGYVRRATHANTEWDFAKFEVCAHGYADISGADGGVALLDDGKYGRSVQGNVLGLTLLRSPMYPDPDADQGRHEFTYVLYPHEGDLAHSDVHARAELLGRRPLILPGFMPTSARCPVWLEAAGLSLTALKKAEKERALIVRVVETLGRRSSGTLRTSLKHARIAETDLMEWKDGPSALFEDGLVLGLEPFEIRTYKVLYGDDQAR
jgi:alpha-mannosidase